MLALNCLLQIEQVSSENGNSGNAPLALALAALLVLSYSFVDPPCFLVVCSLFL